MKHLLNNMSEEEKNAIREQHKGGMKLNTKKFFSLLESKLGDAKPLMEQQTVNVGGVQVPATAPETNYKPDLNKSITDFNQKELENQRNTPSNKPFPNANRTKTTSDTQIGDVTGFMSGETVDLYSQTPNTTLLGTYVVDEIIKDGHGLVITLSRSSRFGGDRTQFFEFVCDKPKELLEIDVDGKIRRWSERVERLANKPIIYYSDRFTAKLVQRFCSTSSGGRPVPKANYSMTSKKTSGAV